MQTSSDSIGETIFSIGEIGDSMYAAPEGEVEIKPNENYVAKIAKPNSMTRNALTPKVNVYKKKHPHSV